jgi:hypothetical protein
MKVEVFQAGVYLTEFIVDLHGNGISGEQWLRHGLTFQMDSDDFTYSIRYTLLHAPSFATTSYGIEISGFCAQRINNFGSAFPAYTQPLGEIRKTVTLNFGPIAHGDYNTIQQTVYGAQIGDFVSLAVTPEMADYELDFSAYVSAANQVTFVARNNNGSGTVNPAPFQVKLLIKK